MASSAGRFFKVTLISTLPYSECCWTEYFVAVTTVGADTIYFQSISLFLAFSDQLFSPISIRSPAVSWPRLFVLYWRLVSLYKQTVTAGINEDKRIIIILQQTGIPLVDAEVHFGSHDTWNPAQNAQHRLK